MNAPKFPLRVSANNLSRTQSLYSSNKAEASKRTSWFGGIFQRKGSQASVTKDNTSAVKNQSALQRRNSVTNWTGFNGGKGSFSVGTRTNSLYLKGTSTQNTGVGRKPDLAAAEVSQSQKYLQDMKAYSGELRELVRLAPNIIQQDKDLEGKVRKEIAERNPNKPLSQLPLEDVVSLLGVDLNNPPKGMEQAAEEFKKNLDMKPDELPIDIRDQIAANR
ncbi:hypothetical protein M9Y10_018178 [Tritrichomonas musculus]|uniref:Uncharacterized protein n=1 Tax=Tritrichomonas musculus TaxID=1915356 RepID=A0ABR2HMY2_9EUKA